MVAVAIAHHHTNETPVAIYLRRADAEAVANRGRCDSGSFSGGRRAGRRCAATRLGRLGNLVGGDTDGVERIVDLTRPHGIAIEWLAIVASQVDHLRRSAGGGV